MSLDYTIYIGPFLRCKFRDGVEPDYDAIAGEDVFSPLHDTIIEASEHLLAPSGEHDYAHWFDPTTYVGVLAAGEELTDGDDVEIKFLDGYGEAVKKLKPHYASIEVLYGIVSSVK